MKTRTDFRPAQEQAISFFMEGEDGLLLGDVGSGKTAPMLTVMEQALTSEAVKRWLVVAPKRVALHTWPNEVEQWDHLSVPVVPAIGTPQQRIDVLESDAPIVSINYENLIWLIKRYPHFRGKKDTMPFDGLVCDEIDKLKDVTTERFHAIRHRVRAFNKRIGMTGTPTANHLTELWGPVFIIDNGQSFGRSFYKWRQKFFYPTDYRQYQWSPLPDTFDHMMTTLSDLVFRMEAEGLPEIVELPARLVDLDRAVRKDYEELERELCVTLNVEGRENIDLDAANAAVLSGKLQQITAGFSYLHLPGIFWHDVGKFKELDNLISELVGQQLFIVYHFKEELAELKRRYKKRLGCFGESDAKDLQVIKDWNSGDLELLAIQPASAGHGLNLQHSGAHHIAFLTLPWSGGMYKQVIGRLCRTGQEAKHIFVHPIIMKDTIDEHVLATVSGKIDRMQDVLEAFG